MKPAYLKPLAGLLLAGSVCLSLAQAPFKVLMIQGTTSDHTPTSDAAKPILTAMAAANGFTIDFSSDHGLLNDATLAQYQVLLQMNLYPFDLTASERTAFQKFVESGKGWVGVHAAGCANNAWPWFARFLGDVTWVSHAELREGTLLFEDRGHPVTRNMPVSIVLKDEWYQFSKSPRARVRVLAKADEKNYSPNNADGDHPLVWILPDLARGAYVSIGHDPGDWRIAAYVDLVRDAILWAGSTSSTRIEAAGGSKVVSAPVQAGRVWIRDGIPDPGGPGRDGGRVRVFDAGGRSMTWFDEGISR
ncbi:MAG: ThuA protein [Fibrobacteres bacterium]|nr:ThuA protein [Fibrobacterota bacterium]